MESMLTEDLGAFMYSAETNKILVTVEPHFIAKEKNHGVEYYVYSYTITLKNNGEQNCQLLSRHWVIRDGQGHEEHVVGEGVVGKQPQLRPGETYSYRSGCPLTTATGSMRGSYQMEYEDGSRFEIKIPLFFLRPDCPRFSPSTSSSANAHY